MEKIRISEAGATLNAVVDRVVADKVKVAITRPGREGVVLISSSEWSSIAETLHLLKSSRNAAMLLASIDGLNAGKGEEHELIEP